MWSLIQMLNLFFKNSNRHILIDMFSNKNISMRISYDCNKFVNSSIYNFIVNKILLIELIKIYVDRRDKINPLVFRRALKHFLF